MRRIVALVPIFLVFAAGCTRPDDCTVSTASCESYGLELVLTPPTLTLAVGDTASATIAVTQGGHPAKPLVHWMPSPAAPATPTIVAIDSATVAQPRVRVRGLAAGASNIGFSVTVDGQTVTGSVPVTVVAR